MILATDNTTMESNFYKGNLSSEKKSFMISLLEFAFLKLNMGLNF